MKRTMLSIYVSLLLGLINNAWGASVDWIGDPLDPYGVLSFCDPSAWGGGAVPDSDDIAYIAAPPHRGPQFDCDAAVADLVGPRNDSDIDHVMDFVSGTFASDSWTIMGGGPGKTIINMSGDSSVTISGMADMGGVRGPSSGTAEINVTENALFKTRWSEDGLRLGKDANTTMVLNISGNARVQNSNEDGWRLADSGTVIVNISEQANIQTAKIRTVDEDDGYIELHMSGGYLEVGSFISMRDDGSGILNFTGGIVEAGGLSFAGRACSSWGEINIGGTAEVSAYEAVRLSYSGCGPSSLNVSGGMLITDAVEMGWGTAERAAQTTLNMTGGLIDAGVEMVAPYAVFAEATINLDGGTINCGRFRHAVPEGDFDENAVVGWEDLARFASDWLIICEDDPQQCPDTDLDRSRTVDLGDYARFASHWGESSSNNWHMDVCGGTMIIEGDVTARIQADIATGHITACDGADGYSLVVDFDNINPGKTTLRVEPSP